MLSTGHQCMIKAEQGKLLCKAHRLNIGTKKKSTRAIKILQESKNNIRINKPAIRQSSLLKDELKKIEEIPKEELLDITRDVKLSEAILEKLLNQPHRIYKKGETYGKKKLKTAKEAKAATEISKAKLIKGLQYTVKNNTEIKKQFYDVKFSDSNMVSKDLYKYTVGMINQIIIDEVKDVEIIKKIGGRIRQLGLDIQAGSIKT